MELHAPQRIDLARLFVAHSLLIAYLIAFGQFLVVPAVHGRRPRFADVAALLLAGPLVIFAIVATIFG